MTDHDTDDPLHRLYREHADEEPPAALDRAILDRARQAAAETATEPAAHSATSPDANPWRQVRRWSGLAAAAVVVLAVGVLLRVPDPTPDMAPAAPAADGQRRSASPSPARAPADEARVGTVEEHAKTFDSSTGEPAVTVETAAPEAGSRVGTPASPASSLRMERSREAIVAAPDPAPAESAPRAAQQPTPADPAPDRRDHAVPVAGAGLEVRSLMSRQAPAAAPCPAARTLEIAADDRYRLCLQGTAMTLRHADCAEPWPVPPGVEVEAGHLGVRVTGDGEEATVYCRDGSWLREPGPERPPPQP